MSEKVSIKPRENGPYLVKNLTRLSNSRGESIACEETMALCRCGQSSNKPFCDGTHKQVGFSSASQADGGRRRDYVGKQITIHDNRRICAHAGKCTDGLPSVWRMGEKPWIDPDGGTVEDIVRVIGQCPSGALSYTLSDGTGEEPAADARIEIAENGPYCVSGPVELGVESWGEGASRNRYTLCRCGASKNKPFCDGSHWDSGFRDERN